MHLLFAIALLFQAVLPLLKLASQRCTEPGLSANKAVIINISSGWGTIVSGHNAGGYYAYKTSKVNKTHS